MPICHICSSDVILTVDPIWMQSLYSDRIYCNFVISGTSAPNATGLKILYLCWSLYLGLGMLKNHLSLLIFVSGTLLVKKSLSLLIFVSGTLQVNKSLSLQISVSGTQQVKKSFIPADLCIRQVTKKHVSLMVFVSGRLSWIQLTSVIRRPRFEHTRILS